MGMMVMVAQMTKQMIQALGEVLSSVVLVRVLMMEVHQHKVIKVVVAVVLLVLMLLQRAVQE
jgi:hypothetical protein